MQHTNDASFGLYRAALKSGMDMMTLYMSGMERMQSAQAEAFHELCADQAEVARKIDATSSLEELQSVQAGFTRTQMERAATYMRGLFMNSYQNQLDFLKEAQAKAREATDRFGEKFEGQPVTPAVSAMRMFVDAAHSAYAAGLRVTEEAAAMTANQMDAGRNAAAAAISQVNAKAKRAAA